LRWLISNIQHHNEILQAVSKPLPQAKWLCSNKLSAMVPARKRSNGLTARSMEESAMEDRIERGNPKPHRMFGRLCLALTAWLCVGCAATNTSAPLAAVATVASSIQPDNLRCEYRAGPLGVDSEHPRLSWILQASDSAERSMSQSAYQILVASSPALLEKNWTDLWNSGMVHSDQSNQIEYAGKPLTSNQRVFWKTD
jgi:hypothetical protein